MIDQVKFVEVVEEIRVRNGFVVLVLVLIRVVLVVNAAE